MNRTLKTAEFHTANDPWSSLTVIKGSPILLPGSPSRSYSTFASNGIGFALTLQ